MSDDLRLRNYSARTERVYLDHVKALGNYYDAPPALLTADEIRAYLLNAINERGCSWSWWRQSVAALRLFYGRTLGLAGMVPNLPYPRREFRLPRVLSRPEVERLLRAVAILKYKVILMTIYSTGLRTTEAVSLATEDIDPGRMVIHVRQGKGRRDRIVPLSATLLDVFRHYWRLQGMRSWVFPGARYDTPVSTGTVQYWTRFAARTAGLPRGVTPRTLRHSFATHLFEAGTQLRTIQHLLGHTTLMATVIYTHLSQQHLAAVRNPLDYLNIDLAPQQLSFGGL
jgi:site-specific recombinase XerD